jgi:hypothetical protein
MPNRCALMAAPRYWKISVARESHYVCNARTLPRRSSNDLPRLGPRRSRPSAVTQDSTKTGRAVDLFVERLGVGIRRPTIFVQLLFEIQELCYDFPGRRIDAAPGLVRTLWLSPTRPGRRRRVGQGRAQKAKTRRNCPSIAAPSGIDSSNSLSFAPMGAGDRYVHVAYVI